MNRRIFEFTLPATMIEQKFTKKKLYITLRSVVMATNFESMSLQNLIKSEAMYVFK